MAEISSAAIGVAGEERRIGLELPAGFRCATPVLAVLLLGFLAPLLTVAAYAFATPRSFDAFRTFTLANFATIFDPANTVWLSFAWSLFLAAMTVVLLAIVCYPIAYGLVRVFGKWAGLVSVLFVFPLFVSENVRLYGWVQFFPCLALPVMFLTLPAKYTGTSWWFVAGALYALAKVFEAFPDDWNDIRRQGLGYFTYSLTEKGKAVTGRRADLETAIEAGLIQFDPIVYEDFLPVSAAGIFQSNLGDEATQDFVASPNQVMFERDLGATVLDEFAHYAGIERASLEMCLGIVNMAAAAE